MDFLSVLKTYFDGERTESLACILPLGIAAGVYLAEYGRGRFATLVRYTTDVLSGVPSIVVGVVAYGLVVVPMGRFSGLAGSVALAILMLPPIIRATEEMVRLVPQSYRQAALAHTAAAWLTLQYASLRIAAAGLHGTVRLRQSDPEEEETMSATLTSDDIRSSVLEEHFTEDELLEIAEALAYATDVDYVDAEFPIETLGETYAAPLLRSLKKSGVTLDIE